MTIQRRFWDRLKPYDAWFAGIAGSLQSQRDDIQGLVLNSYAELSHAAFLLLRIREASKCKAWLRQLAPKLTPASNPAPLRQNIAFTAAGLRKLGLDDETLATFSREFQEGMAAREHLLGDAAQVKHWEFGRDEDGIHILLMIYGEKRRLVDRILATPRECEAAGVERVQAQRAARRPEVPSKGSPPRARVTTREPFGFEDGLSQPILSGFQEALRHRVHPLDRPVLPGEFLLGYVNEDHEIPQAPHVPAAADAQGHLPPLPGHPQLRDLGHNGTYLVLRKLQQDRQAFQTLTGQVRLGHATPSPGLASRGCPFAPPSASHGGRLPGSPAGSTGQASPRARAPRLVAAKLLGRWQDGEPLIPDEERPREDPSEQRLQGFAFRENDPDGLGSPLTSHIRRANPRDSLPLGLRHARGTRRSQKEREDSFKIVRRHRILRRGITYADRGGGEGLLFLALNASIRRQFEFIQQIWLGQDNLSGAGRQEAYVTLPGEPIRTRVKLDPRIVTVRGGAYFFLPSLKALHFLVEVPLANRGANPQGANPGR